MHSIKLTLVIEQAEDIEMEVRVIAHDAPHEAAIAPFNPRVVACRDAGDDEYTLGGYAGI